MHAVSSMNCVVILVQQQQQLPARVQAEEGAEERHWDLQKMRQHSQRQRLLSVILSAFLNHCDATAEEENTAVS